eukprot:SAG25_NODE_1493_length_2905_cov_3.886671_2_plen_100_part_00
MTITQTITQAGGAPRYGADAEHERWFQVEPSCLSWPCPKPNSAEVSQGAVGGPFVGRGTTLVMAEKYGFSCVGVDIDSQQCICARALSVADLEKYLFIG